MIATEELPKEASELSALRKKTPLLPLIFEVGLYLIFLVIYNDQPLLNQMGLLFSWNQLLRPLTLSCARYLPLIVPRGVRG